MTPPDQAQQRGMSLLASMAPLLDDPDGSRRAQLQGVLDEAGGQITGLEANGHLTAIFGVDFTGVVGLEMAEGISVSNLPGSGGEAMVQQQSADMPMMCICFPFWGCICW